MRQFISVCVAYAVLNLFIPTIWDRILGGTPGWISKIMMFSAALVCVGFAATSELVAPVLVAPKSRPIAFTLSVVGLIAAMGVAAWSIFGPARAVYAPDQIRFSRLLIGRDPSASGQVPIEVQYENSGDSVQMAYAHTTLFWVPKATDDFSRDKEAISLWSANSGLDTYPLDRYLAVPPGGKMSIPAVSPRLTIPADLTAWRTGQGFVVMMLKLHYFNDRISRSLELCFYGDIRGQIHMCSQHNGDPDMPKRPPK